MVRVSGQAVMKRPEAGGRMLGRSAMGSDLGYDSTRRRRVRRCDPSPLTPSGLSSRFLLRCAGRLPVDSAD